MESKNVINPSVIYIGPYGEWYHENTWSDSEQVTTYIKSSDNFETALSALIEHYGADALTSLAAVMEHYLMSIYCGIGGGNNVGIFLALNPDPIFSIKPNDDIGSTILTANDIKPEKQRR